jgi:hypothetical protein
MDEEEQQSYTTIADVVEETLGRDLSPENLSYFTKLEDSQVIKIREALQSHTKSAFLRVRRIHGCVFHPNSPTTKAIGGTGWGFGMRLDGTVEEIIGRAYVALMYLPGIVIKDGLEHYLDYFTAHDPEPREERREWVQKILAFYCHFRKQIGERIVIVPRRFWFDVQDVLKRLPSDESHEGVLLKDFAETDYARDNPETRFYTSHRDLADRQSHLKERFPNLLDTNPAANYFAWLAMLKNYRDLRELALFAREHGFSPVLETPEQQLFWRSMMKHSIDVRGKELDWHKVVPEHRVTVPYLGKLPVADFFAAYDADEFDAFRRMMYTIERESRDLDAKPLERDSLIEDRLREAKAELEKRIKKSGVLSKAKSGLKGIGIGLVSNLSAALVNPEWASDPLKMIVVGAVGGVAGAATSLIPALDKTRGEKKIANLYTKILDE